MLNFLDEIADYLQNQSIGTAGTDIFVNKQPADVDNCVTLLGITGLNLADQRDVKELQFPRFQVITRNTDYNDASDTHEAVRTALHNLIQQILPVGVDVNTTAYIRVMRCHAEQEGGPIGEDKKGRSEFSVNFLAEFHHYDPT